MITAIENDLFFDDAVMLENKFGKAYLAVTAENLSPDCNCSGYTSIEEDDEFCTTQIA